MIAMKHGGIAVVKLQLPTSARILFLANMVCVVTGLNAVAMPTKTYNSVVA